MVLPHLHQRAQVFRRQARAIPHRQRAVAIAPTAAVSPVVVTVAATRHLRAVAIGVVTRVAQQVTQVLTRGLCLLHRGRVAAIVITADGERARAVVIRLLHHRAVGVWERAVAIRRLRPVAVAMVTRLRRLRRPVRLRHRLILAIYKRT